MVECGNGKWLEEGGKGEGGVKGRMCNIDPQGGVRGNGKWFEEDGFAAGPSGFF